LFTGINRSHFSNLDFVYVFTDDVEIIEFVEREYHWTSKVKICCATTRNANDTASTESAMLEFSEKINHDYGILCLLQATSPLTLAVDINNGLEKKSPRNHLNRL
jgi:N-acylneuraminate cytidylyltransferase